MSLSRAIEGNARRAAKGGRNVPTEVIKKQYQALLRSKDNILMAQPVLEQYVRDESLEDVILCDLDGSIAHMNDRRKLPLPKKDCPR